MTAAAEEATDLQAALDVVVAAMLAEVAELWPSLDLGNLAASLPEWFDTISDVVAEYAQAAAAVALDSYQVQRDAAGAEGLVEPEPAEPPSEETVTTSLRWATRHLWQPEPDVPAARRDIETAVEKLVLDTARETQMGAIEADPAAVAYARQARPNACGFCAMLATRGAVYLSEDAASTRRKDGKKYHPNCRCQPVPIFAGQEYQPPDHVAQWQELWKTSTSGRSGKDARNAFRRAVESES